jgi:hypothetical protein
LKKGSPSLARALSVGPSKGAKGKDGLQLAASTAASSRALRSPKGAGPEVAAAIAESLTVSGRQVCVRTVGVCSACMWLGRQ